MSASADRLQPRLYALLLAFALIFAVLQPAVADHAINQYTTHSHQQAQQHDANISACEADCTGTVHQCCLYALCASKALTLFQAPTTQHAHLPYFFASRPITPPTQPPKAV